MGNLPKANSSQLQLLSAPEMKGWRGEEFSFFQHKIQLIWLFSLSKQIIIFSKAAHLSEVAHLSESLTIYP